MESDFSSIASGTWIWYWIVMVAVSVIFVIVKAFQSRCLARDPNPTLLNRSTRQRMEELPVYTIQDRLRPQSPPVIVQVEPHGLMPPPVYSTIDRRM